MVQKDERAEDEGSAREESPAAIAVAINNLAHAINRLADAYYKQFDNDDLVEEPEAIATTL